ncbi:hypothetical protein KLER11_gp81 [Pararheinheimera phage vB_PsoM_KLER1-1]|nr:hypothetical protein KLER11_gp81 [Pararheinheimera phage vB_PsoM_KLER1-1]
MKMIQVKTSELTGPALDWAVGTAMGNTMRQHKNLEIPAWFDADNKLIYLPASAFSPSTDWAHGGPLLAELMASSEYGITPFSGGACQISNTDNEGFPYNGDMKQGHFEIVGDNLLMAACRAVVASKLGDVVEVPAELVEGISHD